MGVKRIVDEYPEVGLRGRHEGRGFSQHPLRAASGTPQLSLPGSNGLGTIRQGALEGSNVNVVEELVGLIEAQRAYEMNSKAISAVDSMMQYADQVL